MTIKEKATKIATEYYQGETKENLMVKYNLTKEQFLGMLITVIS